MKENSQVSLSNNRIFLMWTIFLVLLNITVIICITEIRQNKEKSPFRISTISSISLNEMFFISKKNIDMSSPNRIWTRENSRLSKHFKWVRNFLFWNLTRKHDPIYKIRCLSNCGVGPLLQVTNLWYEKILYISLRG